VPIGIGIIAFAYGGVKFAVEMLIIGAIMIVVGVVMFVVSNITNDVMQGVVISAVGLALLLVSYVVITRNNRVQA
jgi:vacuolar-type H+-ATPase subunit I/STV1